MTYDQSLDFWRAKTVHQTERNRARFPAGSHWVCNIPPGWVIGFTVVDCDEDSVILKDVAYIESTPSGSTTVGDVPLAKTVKEQLRVCTKSYELPDGARFRIETLLLQMPAQMSLAALARREAANAIRGAK